MVGKHDANLTKRAGLMVLVGMAAALGATLLAPTVAGAVDDQDCSNFVYQQEAQAHLNADRSDPDNLDFDNDGLACEDELPQLLTSGPQTSQIQQLPGDPAPPTVPRPAAGSVPPLSSPTVTPIGPDDQSCADFANQDDAQAHLNADLSDPDVLDEDDDGFACEGLPRRSGAAAATNGSNGKAKSSIPATGNGDMTYLMILCAGAALLMGGNLLGEGARHELRLQRRREPLTAPPPAE